MNNEIIPGLSKGEISSEPPEPPSVIRHCLVLFDLRKKQLTVEKLVMLELITYFAFKGKPYS